jgi:hypothetical protein
MPIMRARTPYRLGRRGLGQTTAYLQDPCDCFTPLSGIPNAIANPNGKPQCNPATGLAPGCTQDEPPCNGIPYGAPGYAACFAAQGESTAAAAQQESNLAAMGITFTPAAYSGPVSVAAPTVASPVVGQSNAPSPAAVAKPARAAAQSNAPTSVSMIPAATASSFNNTMTSPAALSPAPACFSLFSGESCFGPIGSMTALAIGGGILGLWLLFGGHK